MTKSNKFLVKSSNAKMKKLSLFDDGLTTKTKTNKVDKYISIINSELKFKIDSNSITLMFIGARLLTVNQIFALLQSRKYEVFKYKKAWHQRVWLALCEIKSKHNLPLFDSAVELSLFRSDKRNVDEDSLTTMFKFLIDSLKINKENNLGILKDDNKTIVTKIHCFTSIGNPVVGIKIRLSNEKQKQLDTLEFLEN